MMTALALCMTGSSGSVYGVRLGRAVLEAGIRLHLVISAAAFRVLEHEEGIRLDPLGPDLSRLLSPAGRSPLPEQILERVSFHPVDRIDAAPSSGSSGIGAVVIGYDTKIPIQNGKFEDQFQGYEVKLFKVR